MGQIERYEEVHEIFLHFKVDPIPVDIFLRILKALRLKHLSETQTGVVTDAFEALYAGMCPDDTNRDENGRKFLIAEDFRELLTSHGDILTDEEADMLIRECNPSYTIYSDGTRKGRIYLENYRSFLLDKAAALLL